MNLHEFFRSREYYGFAHSFIKKIKAINTKYFMYFWSAVIFLITFNKFLLYVSGLGFSFNYAVAFFDVCVISKMQLTLKYTKTLSSDFQLIMCLLHSSNLIAFQVKTE